MRRRVANALPALMLVVALLGIWELYVDLGGVEPLLLPAPHELASALWENTDLVWSNFKITAKEVLLGLGLALLSGFAVAVAIHLWRPFRRAVYPLAVGSQAVPIAVIAPLLVFWWGFGIFPKLVVIALICFFPVVVTTVDGLAAVDPDQLKLLRTLDASRWQAFRFAELPAALPAALSGARIAVAVGVIAAFIAETQTATVGPYGGLGREIVTDENCLAELARVGRSRGAVPVRDCLLLHPGARRAQAGPLEPPDREELDLDHAAALAPCRAAIPLPRVPTVEPRAARPAAPSGTARGRSAGVRAGAGGMRSQAGRDDARRDQALHGDAGLLPQRRPRRALRGDRTWRLPRGRPGRAAADPRPKPRNRSSCSRPGKVDMAISYEPELLLARDQGLKLVSIGALVQRPLTSIIALPGQHVSNVKDLAGKRVGTAGIPYQAAELRTALQSAGVSPAKVQEVNVGFNLVPAMLSGKVAATLGGFWNYEAIQLQLLHKHPVVIPVNEAGVPNYDELVLVVRAGEAHTDGQDLRAFLQALTRGEHEVRSDPAAAAKLVQAANPSLEPKLQLESIERTLPAAPAGRSGQAYGYQDPSQWVDVRALDVRTRPARSTTPTPRAYRRSRTSSYRVRGSEPGPTESGPTGSGSLSQGRPSRGLPGQGV